MSGFSFLGGMGGAFRHRDYRVYWSGLATSNVGRWLFVTAVGWLSWELTRSTTWLGIIGFAYTFPTVVFSLHGGAIADRLGYLRVTRFNILVMAVLATGFAYLVHAGLADIWIVLLFTTLIGSVNALTSPAQLALVHPLVPRDDLAAAIAIGSATFNVARFIGPAIAGGLISWVGLSVVIALYGLSLFIYAGALWCVRLIDEPGKLSTRSGMLGEITESIGYILGEPGIRFLMILLGVTGLFIRPYMELLPGFSAEVFGRGVDGLAILLSATGFGAIFSGLWLARRGRTQGLTGVITFSLMMSALALAGFVATRHIWIAAACASGIGFFFLAGGIASQTLIQNAVQSRMRARAMSLFIGISFGVPALGALTAGWAASFFGLQPVIGAGAVITFLVWALYRGRGKRLAGGLEKDSMR